MLYVGVRQVLEVNAYLIKFILWKWRLRYLLTLVFSMYLEPGTPRLPTKRYLFLSKAFLCASFSKSKFSIISSSTGT